MGRDSSILSVWVLGRNIRIGANSVVNDHCLLDGRLAMLDIGNNVDIAPQVRIWTVEHDPQSNVYAARAAAVTIGDHAWIASAATLLITVKYRHCYRPWFH